MEFKYGQNDPSPLEGYKIMRGVGKGAFGEVYFAVSEGGRHVALKRLGDNAEIELRGVARCINIKNPHLLSIFDIKTGTDNRPYLIMEYVVGDSLRDLLDKQPKGLGNERTCSLFKQIASGVSALHKRNIVHRDLKPENIFIEDGFVKIGDYGLSKHISISKVSKQTINLGTIHYMAPEIATGGYDHKVDIYALGIILYEMLTGDVPFTGMNYLEIALKHSQATIDLNKLPHPFRSVVKNAASKNPAQRYQTVEEMVEGLEKSLAMSQSSAGAEQGRQKTKQRLYHTAAAPQRPAPIPNTGTSRPITPKHRVRSCSSIFEKGHAGQRLFVAAFISFAAAVPLAIMPLPIQLPQVPTGFTLLPACFLTIFLSSMLCSWFAGWCSRRRKMTFFFQVLSRSFAAGLLPLLFCLFYPLFYSLEYRSPPLYGFLHPDSKLTDFAIPFLLCTFLLNWNAAAYPGRNDRISFSQVLAAAIIGLAGSFLIGELTFLISGILAGVMLNVNFLAPLAGDRKTAADAEVEIPGSYNHAAPYPATVQGDRRPPTSRIGKRRGGFGALGWIGLSIGILFLYRMGLSGIVRGFPFPRFFPNSFAKLLFIIVIIVLALKLFNRSERHRRRQSGNNHFHHNRHGRHMNHE